jgi:hypothetical protein
MNLQETLSLIEALKYAGVTKFKSLEHEISFDGGSYVKKEETKTQVKASGDIVPNQEVHENKEATKKIEDLISTLKMSDEDLANQIFPDGAL